MLASGPLVLTHACVIKAKLTQKIKILSFGKGRLYITNYKKIYPIYNLTNNLSCCHANKWLLYLESFVFNMPNYSLRENLVLHLFDDKHIPSCISIYNLRHENVDKIIESN